LVYFVVIIKTVAV